MFLIEMNMRERDVNTVLSFDFLFLFLGFFIEFDLNCWNIGVLFGEIECKCYFWQKEVRKKVRFLIWWMISFDFWQFIVILQLVPRNLRKSKENKIQLTKEDIKYQQ